MCVCVHVSPHTCDSSADLSSKTVSELKDVLRAYQLPITGTRDTLLSRLLDYMKETERGECRVFSNAMLPLLPKITSVSEIKNSDGEPRKQLVDIVGTSYAIDRITCAHT